MARYAVVSEPTGCVLFGWRRWRTFTLGSIHAKRGSPWWGHRAHIQRRRTCLR